EVIVLTTFRGVDDSTTPDEPKLFESRVFGGVLDGEETLYGTREHALRGHEALAAMCREGSLPDYGISGDESSGRGRRLSLRRSVLDDSGRDACTPRDLRRDERAIRPSFLSDLVRAARAKARPSRWRADASARRRRAAQRRLPSGYALRSRPPAFARSG